MFNPFMLIELDKLANEIDEDDSDEDDYKDIQL